MKHNLKCIHCDGGIFNGNDGRWYCKNNQSCTNHTICYTINYDSKPFCLHTSYCSVNYNDKFYVISQNLLDKSNQIIIYKYWNKFIGNIEKSSKIYSPLELDQVLPTWLLFL